MRPIWTLVAATFLTSGCLTAAFAAENGNSQYAPGASQFFAGAVPPFQGLYFLSQTSYFSSTRTNNGAGHEIPINFDVKAVVETLRFLYVSDIHLGGAQVWGQIVLPIIHLNVKTASGSGNDFSLADTTASLGLAWHPDQRQTFVTGIDLGIPTGSYNAASLANAGLNHWSIQPTVGYHFSDPEGLEFATTARLIFNFENTATHYTNGNEFVLDYAVGWNFGKTRLGAVGYYIKQFTGDSGSGAPADGHKGEGFAIGPSFTYSFNPGMQVSASWQRDLVAKNRAQGDTVWVNFATKF